MKKRTSQKERYEALYAASEPFRRAKTETIHTLAGIGRRHRLLRYPIMAALVVYIFIYNLILYGCIQLKMRERLARGVALLMTAVLVLTSVDATVFAAIENAGASGQGKGVITAFSRLDESVAVQVLPVGAKESEITLPDTLAVTLKTGSEDKPEESTTTTEESTTAPEESTTATEESTTAPKESTTATEESTTAPEESTAATEESTTAAEESTKQEETSAATEDTKTEENVPVKNIEQSSTEGTSAAGENNLSSLLPQPMVVHAAELDERASAKSEVLIDVTWKPDADKSTSGTFDSSEVGNRYVYMPVIPEDYTVAEGVKLPEITITIEENLEDKTATAAEKLLEKILQTYFEGLTEDEIYDAILRMDKDTRLALTADYEELLAAQTAEDEDNERLQKQIKKIGDALMEAAGNEPIEEPVFLGLRSTAVRASASGIALKRQGGSGEAFIYHSFNETTTFAVGRTYAFLNGKYGSGDAVSALGSGAILKATNKQNDSKGYITNYYNNASVEVYVDVVTPGSDFDWCVIGGLYKVPNTQNPTEYRYFCGYGGARNCGPYYAYNYQRESVTSSDVSASLKNINKQGSENPGDYTVTITYDGNKSKVLDSGSYTVDYIEPDTARFVISDSEGNSLTVNFQSPLAVRYDGNSKNVSGIPSIQEAWKNKSITLSAQKPTRTGYSFVNWKDADTGTTYAAGQSCTPAKSVKLLAQWKDTQAPDFNYTNVQVMTSDSDEAVKNAVKAALTITDNEPASECTVTVTLPADFNKTPGNKDVTVKVTDKAGNTTTKTCSVYVDSYVDIARPVFTKGSKNITAVLNGPGTDEITESGFVWGVINSPTLTLNNGRATTAAPVSKVGDRISVTAGNLQKGVQYYARAYIIAGGETYYSEEIPIGLGLPDYGKFTISNNGSSTFTVTRDGSEGTQTVYYRTVNGSAVGGTHFKHKNGTLTFAPGDNEETIKITEYGANTAYSGKPATAYTNADRTYSVEIYHVTGGAALGDTTSAERTMKTDSEYNVNRSVYTTEKSRSVNTNDDNNYVVDRDDVWEKQVSFINNRGYNNSHGNKNFNVQRSIDVGNDKENAYLKETATGFSYKLKLSMTEHSWAGGYEHVWISNHEPNDLNGKSEHGDTISLDDSKFGKAYYTARWEIKGHSEGDETGYFPGASGVTWAKQSERSGKVSDGYVLFAPKDTAQVWFTATGGADNIWHVNSYTDWLKVSDTQEPKLVKVAPMAGGTYKVGDSFTVSLIFDEIVDSTNSGSLTNIKVDTTWGEASYKGGVDTNVLYFTGKIKNDPSSTTLSVSSFTNPGNIKDMCNDHDKATESGGGGTGATVDISTPNFTVKPNDSITNGTGTATIKVEADQSKTTGMSYAWSNSTNLPASGWVELSSAELSTAKSSSGLPLSIRKQPGSGDGGKWYLHVKGVYATTGASSHKYATLDFGTEASPAAGSTSPKLSVTADNTNWATSRTINITQEGAEEIKYRKSGATSWKSLNPSTTSVTVYDNGNYTFLLKAGDESITKTVTVEKIDKVDPAASIGELTGGSVESPKSGVYTKLVLPITYSDAQSGVKTVNYSWADSTSSPYSWTSLPAGAATVTYTATESTPTKKYLHIKVADKVNHIYKTYSVPYTVISQTAVNDHAPKISITGAPTKWTNDMATLTWQLQNYNGKNYEVILPSGKKQTAENGEVSKGEVWARQNGTYTVKVHDLEYGGENTASITVNKLDFAAPSVTVSGGSDDWENTNQTFTISASDTQSGVGEKWYKIVTKNSEIPVEGLTKLNGNQITVNKDGEYYVYYKVYDNTGDTAAGREANKTEGFTRLVKIDKTAPVIGELTYSYQPKKLWNWLIGKDSLTITVPVTEEGSGADKISYKVMPEGGSSATKTAEIKDGSAKITVSADFKGEISITCTDKARNTSSGVTVGTSGNGLILEDNAPQITFSTYTAASGITVTVKDDKDNAISAGLASVTYTIGNSTKAVSGDFNENKENEVSFIIPAKDIPTGGAVIAVEATDHAGNQAEQTKEIAKYNVTYDYGTNGGVSAVSDGKVSDVVLSGDAIDLTPKAKKDGWEFVGWNTDKNAVNGLTSLKMGTKDVTLYAIYSKTLTGTFYSGNAGQSETVSVTIYNTAKSGSIALPALKGWTGDSHGFTAVGWLPDSGEALPAPVDSKDLLNAGGSYALSENKSFYGKYKLDVTLSFDANGGEGSEDAVSGIRYAVVEQSKITYPDAGEVTLPAGNHMSRAGYAFAGWTAGGTAGTVFRGGASAKLPEQDTVYYASWADTKQPELTAGIQSGVQANDDGWYNVETLHIALDYSDNEGVAKLYAKVDDGDFAQISGISTEKGTSFTKDYACTEGEHTYTFKAEDAAGNITETEAVTVKWDKTKPEIGEITCEQKAANILDWIIGKESLIVSIPVTDSLSGVKTLTYTETTFTKDGEETEEKTVSLSGKEQTAKLTLDADWKGKITDIRCTDTAGNISDTKSIEGAGDGIIVEDNAPVITILADRNADGSEVPQGTAVSDMYYDVAPKLSVTVKDGEEGNISGGLASVSWKIGDGSVQTAFPSETGDDGTHSEDGGFADSISTSYSFTVEELVGRTGIYTVTVDVKDHAGNTGSEEVTVRIKAKEAAPEPVIDYRQEKLTGLVPGDVYVIGNGTGRDAVTADEEGCIPVKEEWFGEALSIYKRAKDITLDSDSIPLSIAARPVPPTVAKTDETIKAKQDGTLTGVSADMEYSVDGGKNWISLTDSDIMDGTLKDLAPGTVQIRIEATDTAPHGEQTEVTIAEGRTLTVSFESNGGSSVASVTEKTWKDTVERPENPVKEGYSFDGWYRDNGFTDIWHFADEAAADCLTEDITLYAKWKDVAKPNLNAVLADNKDEKKWHKELSLIVTFSDNEGVTKLYVKRDSEEYEEFPSNGSGVGGGAEIGTDAVGNMQYQLIFDELAEGEHTYTFKAEDAMGNITETEAVTAKWDKTKPEIGEITCEQKAANILDWIIGKESLIVSIPVTDSLSGVKTLTYTETTFTKDGEETEEKTVSLSGKEQTAKLTLDADWKGTITDIRCKDTAGNISDAKSIEGAGNGIIVENNAPVIKFTSPASNENGWYNRNIAIAVAVTDDKDSESAVHLSGGIAEIKWKEGKDGEEQTVTDLDGNAPVYEHEFTISVNTDGTHTYYVSAVDNAGNESGWQTVTAKVDTGKPEFAGSLTVTNPTVEGADITLTSSEDGKVYYIVSDAGAAPDAQEVKEQGIENGSVKSVTDGTEGSFTIKGLTPGEKHTVYVVLEDAAGNLSEVKKESFFTMPEVPELTMEQITMDYTNETMKLPDTIGEVEVYTNPDDPSGSKITPDDDGFLPVTPGTVIYIRYPERTKDGLTVPASDKIEIQIPDRPVPADKQVTVTDNAITLTNPDSKEEYVLVKKGEAPDWSKANTTGQFTGLDADTEYDLYVRVKATENNFVSVPVKLELRTKDHILQKTEAKTPTCTEAGNREYFTCSDCHKLFEDEQGKTETDSAKVTIPAAGHTEVTDKAKAATCTKTGLTEGRHCSVCGAILKKQKTVAALGHDYSAGYQYNKDGHWKSCSRCGKEDEKHSHTYDNGRDTLCNDCGYERTITKPKEDDEKKPGNDDEKNTADEQADTQDNTPEKEQNPDSTETQTVPATVDNGKITVPGNPVATGDIDGATDTDTALMIGDGAVIVTVDCKEQKCTAGVADTVAVANAVLTPEQIQLVNNGETIEIRIDVTDISDKIPLQEQEVIESGVEEYQKELPKLMLGTYVDISMFIKIGESDWNAITETNEPIEIILGIPENLKETGRTYYIIRSHEGEHTLLTDLDDNPDTITISTGLFSAYAIAYEQIDVQKSGTENHKCGLCHICPTFLGICYFIWLAIIVLTIILVLSILYKRKEREEEKHS